MVKCRWCSKDIDNDNIKSYEDMVCSICKEIIGNIIYSTMKKELSKIPEPRKVEDYLI